MKRGIFKKFFGKRYLLILLSFMVLGVFLFLVERNEHFKTQKIYGETINSHRDFLKDTVNNIVIDIENTCETSIAMYNIVINEDLQEVRNNIRQKGLDFIKHYIGQKEHGTWYYAVYKNDDLSVVDDSLSIIPTYWDGNQSVFDNIFATYRTVSDKGLTYIYGILKVSLDNSIENIFRNKIHSMTFSEDKTNIMVRKVLNYAGGTNYAKCLIDLYQPENEGTYYSAGQLTEIEVCPYAEELYNLLRNGSTFISQVDFAKNITKERQMVSYSKLCKTFDWIVTMTIYTSSIEGITPVISGKKPLIVKSVLPVGILLMVLLTVTLFVCIYSDQKRYVQDRTFVPKKLKLEELTKTDSRLTGQEDLDYAWKRYSTNPENSPAVMLMKIDDFKMLNDIFGHGAGDLVLQNTINTINGNIRHSDMLIKWSSDLFLGIFYGMEPGKLPSFAQKIIDSVGAMRIDYKNQPLQVTLSLGFSFFNISDQDSDDVLKRADNALYKSMLNGGNTYTIL